MPSSTTTSTSYVAKLRQQIADEPFVVECTRGKIQIWPLEPRGEYTWEEKDNNGQVKKVHEQPSIEFDRYSGLCVIPRKGKANLELIKAVEQKFADHESGEWPDERIDQNGFRIANPGEVSQPFRNFDALTALTIAEMVANMLEGDATKDRELLDQCIRYELQRSSRTDASGDLMEVREDVLAELDRLAEFPGDEDEDAEVEA